jgi:hypothetical protein
MIARRIEDAVIVLHWRSVEHPRAGQCEEGGEPEPEMPLRPRTLLGDRPGALALKDGSLISELVPFDFATYSANNKGFEPRVREQAFDVAEMAIVTYLLAKSFGEPWCCCRTCWWRGINMLRLCGGGVVRRSDPGGGIG